MKKAEVAIYILVACAIVIVLGANAYFLSKGDNKFDDDYFFFME